MQDEIPFVIQDHALWAFYQGLRLGVQLSDACLEKL